LIIIDFAKRRRFICDIFIVWHRNWTFLLVFLNFRWVNDHNLMRSFIIQKFLRSYFMMWIWIISQIKSLETFIWFESKPFRWSAINERIPNQSCWFFFTGEILEKDFNGIFHFMLHCIDSTVHWFHIKLRR
jgi:hypothetical protein